MPIPSIAELDNSYTIQKFGFIKENLSYSKDLLNAERRSSILHLIDDIPVSNKFSYFLENKKIYLDVGRSTPLYLAKEERNGKIIEGIILSTDYCVKNPGNLAFLYSPPGIVTFENDKNNYLSGVKPYRDGQLYVYWGDKEKINAVAISISKESGEFQWLRKIFPGLFKAADSQSSEKEYITYLITTPVLTKLNLDTFTQMNNLFLKSDIEIYKNIHNQRFKLSDILNLFILGIDGLIKPKHDIDELDRDLIRRFGTTEVGMEKKHLHALDYVMRMRGDSKIMVAGSCGGDTVLDNELTSLLGIEKLSAVTLVDNTKNPLSTSNRTFKALKNGDKDNNDDTYPCPHCAEPIAYEENPDDKTSWKTVCPNCGGSLTGQCQ